jgi:hypothetical protein
MEAHRSRPVTRYWLQMTTGKLHTRQSCGMSRRTRYDHAYVDLTPAEAAEYPKCAKCFQEASDERICEG